MGRDAEAFLGAGFWVCSDSFTVLFQRLCSKYPYLCPHETTGATNCRTAHGGRRPANLGFSEGFASVDSRHKELGEKRLRGDSPQRRIDAGGVTVTEPRASLRHSFCRRSGISETKAESPGCWDGVVLICCTFSRWGEDPTHAQVEINLQAGNSARA